MVDFVMNGLFTVKYPGTTPVNISPPPLTVKVKEIDTPVDDGYYVSATMSTEYRASTYIDGNYGGRMEMWGNVPQDTFVSRTSKRNPPFVENTSRRTGSNDIGNDKIRIGDFRGRVVEISWWTEIQVVSHSGSVNWDDQDFWNDPKASGNYVIYGDMGFIALEKHAGTFPSGFNLTYNNATAYCVHHADGLYFVNFSAGSIGGVSGNNGDDEASDVDAPIKKEIKNLQQTDHTFYFNPL